MDKRSASILIGCGMCTTVVALLFLVAYNLTLRSCELIFIEPSQHRLAALDSWKNTPARRSQDKSMLLKMSAHLEYNLRQSSLSSHHSAEPFLLPPMPTQQNLSGGPMGLTYPQLPQAQFLQMPSPTPNGFPNGATPQIQPLLAQQAPNIAPGTNKPQPQQPQPSLPLTNATTTTNQQLMQLQMNNTARERFLPLALDRVEFERKHNESAFEYKLHMNCTTITAIFVRQADKIRLNVARLELKVQNQKRTKCELLIPDPSLFEVEIDPKNGGLAHYHNQPSEPLRCIDKKNGDLLALLDIHALEFESALNPKKEVGKKFKHHQAI